MTINGLIFDYGGVILDMRWDVSRTLEVEHGLRELALVETLYSNETWRQIERGIGDREAWLSGAHAELEAAAGRALPPLHEHWRERQHLIAPNIDLIGRLRPPYRTAVLSNADGSLVPRMRDEYGIHDLFDDIVCSADVGMAKPEPGIYVLAAKRLGLPPEECVFIDDLERNLGPARAAGMQTVHFRVDLGHDLEAQLGELGVRARS